jgi:8-amino-7-oxononanoate synthase
LNKFDFIDHALEDRHARHLFRRFRSIAPETGPMVSLDGKLVLNCCSNDYLGLSKHPLLRERAAEFMDKFGAGATASRHICGNLSCFDGIEKKLADLKGSPSALIMNAGYQTNIALLSTLADRDSLILSDWLNHNSLIRGALLARCRVERFRHNDLAHLAQLLTQSRKKAYSRVLIVTESVFSMDGDRCDVDALIELANAFNAILYMDEAHATGVFGVRGMGLTAGKKVDVVMGTFSKGCGAYGAYVTCSEKIRDYLINCCHGLIFTTALPPAVLGSIDAALDLVPQMDAERAQLSAHADYLRNALLKMGWQTGASTTQIVPVVIGGEEETMALSAFLENRGIMATGIRPPTVEAGQSRIRLTLTALHTRQQAQQVIDAFKAWSEQHGR